MLIWWTAAAEDTTQLEGPDTPAPVFAARAIKNAIFGATTDQPTDRIPTISVTMADTAKPKPTLHDDPKDNDALPAEFRSPTKLNSILLTPGTGTARRKRVSFGGDVKTSASAEPSPFEINKSGKRRNTALQQALENSRKNKKLVSQPQPEELTDVVEGVEEEWDGEYACNHDVTVDLNEPHSGSGKYWKTEFDRYHEDAKAEMTALVKYKHLAKSYAKQKDSESLQLARQLKEEQEKVADLEKRLKAADGSGPDKQTRNDKEREQSALVRELAKQTALAVEYKGRIRELEASRKDKAWESDTDQAGRRQSQTSPRDEKTLLEVHRELRRVKSELKQMEGLCAENDRLRAALDATKDRTAQGDEVKTSEGAAERARSREFGNQLREVKEELRKEKSELRKVRRDYETLKRDAKLRTVEAMQVLQEKNEKISQLEDEIRSARKERDSTRQQKGIDEALAKHHRITRDFETDLLTRTKVSADNKSPRRRQRSLSVEDFTLDQTAEFARTPYSSRARDRSGDRERQRARGSPSKPQTAAYARTLAKKDTFQNDDWASSRHQLKESKSYRDENDQVLTNLLNDAEFKTNRQAIQNESGDRYARNTYQNPVTIGDDMAGRTGAGSPSKATAFSEAHAQRYRPTYENDKSIDLLQDRFVQLGNGGLGKPSTGNASRCSLPPDRLAAARARLEQKKLERMQPTASRMQEMEKENYMP